MIYEIPFSYEMYGTYEIEADSLEEAISLSEELSLADGSPSDVDGSYSIDRDTLRSMYPDEDF